MGQSRPKLVQRSHGFPTTFSRRRKRGGERRIDLSRAGRTLTAIFAALSVSVIPVARDQQDRVFVAIGQHPQSRNLSLIVDIKRIYNLKFRSRENEGIQVVYGAILPQEHVLNHSHTIRRTTHGLSP